MIMTLCVCVCVSQLAYYRGKGLTGNAWLEAVTKSPNSTVSVSLHLGM
jgi:hypothetical protein